VPVLPETVRRRRLIRSIRPKRATMSLLKWMWRWLHDPLLTRRSGYTWASMKPDGITLPRKGS